jgi:hypothetical protein
MNYSGRGIPQTRRKNNISSFFSLCMLPTPSMALSWLVMETSDGGSEGKKFPPDSHVDKVKLFNFSAKPVARKSQRPGEEKLGKKRSATTQHRG